MALKPNVLGLYMNSRSAQYFTRREMAVRFCLCINTAYYGAGANILA